MTLIPAGHDPILRHTPAEPPDYRYFNLHTNHANLGAILGQHDPPFAMQPWWAEPPSSTLTRECAAVVRSLHAPLMDEFAAYADAQSWDADKLWQQCCRVNLKARFRLGTEGCSTFAWHTGRYVVVGRNYDYWPLQARRQRIRFQPLGTGYASLGARGGVPCGRYDGINEHGLFISLHVVMTDTPHNVRPGVPFHLVGRLALELCRSAVEAVEQWTHIPHLSSLNYLAADANEAFVVEADPRRVRVLPAEDGMIAVTNHFRHPDMRPLQGNRVLTNSACRHRTLSEALDVPLSQQDPDTLLECARQRMADRTAPVCGVSGSLTTLWSCVAELSSRRIQYAPGAPHVTPFEELPTPGPEIKPSKVQ
jgi:hypothetical protein